PAGAGCGIYIERPAADVSRAVHLSPRRHRAVYEWRMRPSLLDPLFGSLRALPGVGPKVEKLFGRLLGREETPPRIIDLLFHLPTGTVDRRAQPKLRDVVPGTV